MSKNRLDEMLRDFYTISGMDVSVVDRDFHTLSMARCEGETICSLLHRSAHAIDECKESDIDRLSEVRNSTSPLIYTCPFGITEAIIPIIRDDEVIGYLISALGIKIGHEDEVLCLSQTVAAEDPKIREIIHSSRKLSEDELLAYFNTLRILSSYIANDSSLIDRSESVGQLIKKYVKNNLERKLTLKDISRNLHCSTVTLTEHFRKEFGITINEYITKKRMNLSETMLISTDKPLREIASLCGFPDVEYFSRTFKKFHGISPAAWRKRKGKTNDDNT